MSKAIKKSLAVFLSVLTLLSCFYTTSFAWNGIEESYLSADRVVTAEKEYRVTKGVTERHIVLNNTSNNNQIKSYIMEVDLSNPDISVMAGYNNADATSWSMSTVPEQAVAMEKKTGLNVIGACNGDYYNTKTGEPVGMLIMNGTMYHDAVQNYPYFAILNDGSAVIRPAGSPTDDVKEAIGGRQILVKNGVVYYHGGEGTAKHPRTAVGIKADGTLVVMVADGRQQPDSCGMDMNTLADTMKALGCVDALNLDGGGSSTFMSERESISDLSVRNSPCYGFERPVASSLMICSSAQPTGEFDHITFTETELKVHPNHSIKIEAVACDINGFKTELSGGKLVVADGSFGSITGNSFLAKSKEGIVNINYVVGDQILASVPVEITYDADNFIEQFIKAITQAFANMRQLIEFVFEKLTGKA